MSILIKNGQLNGTATDVLINGNLIAEIAADIDSAGHTIIDASGKAILPGLINGHTHAAMTLFRGYGDDMELYDWLNNKIWPVEAKLTETDVYWGTKLACLEMIKSGTTCFNDMYWHWDGTAKAVDEMGIRAFVGGVFIDLFDTDKAQEQQEMSEAIFAKRDTVSNRIKFTLAPHAIYTVSEDSLRWIKAFADTHDLLIHTHVSETAKEVEDCIDQHSVRPVEYLEKLGFLGPNLVIAHAIWLNAKEIEILGEYNVKVVTNPCANMKLASGAFPFTEVQNGNITIGIGTDGVGSNNNLDLFEEMKFVALGEKLRTLEPTAAPATEIFECATRNGAQILGLNCGSVEEGKLADLILVDLTDPTLSPGHNLISDAVYSANGSVVDTVICDGELLMQNRNIDGEEEIIENVKKVARDLFSR